MVAKIGYGLLYLKFFLSIFFMNSVCVTHIIFVGVFMTNLEMSNKTDAFGSWFCLRKNFPIIVLRNLIPISNVFGTMKNLDV